MCLLVRKVERTKWLQRDIIHGEDASADAITNCMKTKGNCLSVWEIASESMIEDAVLAIASQFDHLDTIDVVLIRKREVSGAELELQATPGKTPVDDLVDSHRNIAKLSYRSLGSMARLIISAFTSDRVKRFTAGQLKTILKSAIGAGRLDQQALKESVREKLA